MAYQLSDQELEYVVGGSVNLSEKKNKIGFDTIGEGYTLKCTFKVASKKVAELFAENQNLTEKEFDILVRDVFRDNKWI